MPDISLNKMILEMLATNSVILCWGMLKGKFGEPFFNQTFIFPRQTEEIKIWIFFFHYCYIEVSSRSAFSQKLEQFPLLVSVSVFAGGLQLLL